MAAANVCTMRREPAAVGQLAVDTSTLEDLSFLESDIDRDILQMLLGVGYAASTHDTSQLQQSQHTSCQQQALRLDPQHSEPPQHLASCSLFSDTQDAFAPNHRLSTMPSANIEISSYFSHVQSTIDSPQTAKRSAVAHLQQQWSPASSNLQQPQSSNPVHFLRGNLPARQPLEQPASSGWHFLMSGDLSMTDMVPSTVVSTADAAFSEHTYAVPPTAGPYYYTPVADSTAALGVPAADLAAAAAAAVTDVCSPITSSGLPPQQRQQRRLVTPAVTAGDAASPAADATDGSNKRGRWSDSSSRNNNNSNNKKRQKLPSHGEKALIILQHKYATVTDENAALRTQVSNLQSEKNELVDRMSGLTHKWQATVAELARLHRENLALLESLPVVVPRFRGY